MMIRYEINSLAQLHSQVEIIEREHLFGDVFLDLVVPAFAVQETILRKLTCLHRCVVGLIDTNSTAAASWLDAGASELILSDNAIAGSCQNLPDSRISSRRPRLATNVAEWIEQDETGSTCYLDPTAAAEMIGEFIIATTVSDRADGLIPTVVTDRTGVALGLVYSNGESIQTALQMRRGVYWSRSRGQLWIKGQESGAEQRLLRIDIDCDRDTLRFVVDQKQPGFCHLNRQNCFSDKETELLAIERHIANALQSGDPNSYSRRIANDSEFRQAKIREEANEVCRAISREEITNETADLVYFAIINALANDISMTEVVAELDRRRFKISRRAGNAKQEYLSPQ